jgi:ribokinase
MPRKRIVVIGSINMDLVCRTPVMPKGGQTILGGQFLTIPGGKGANQAVAAARLAKRGAEVHMVGRVGADEFGTRLLEGLRSNRVKTDHVAVTKGVSSGVAMILVDAKGENSIVVSPGANAKVTPADVDAARDVIASAAVVVLQLEIPLDTVQHAIALCRKLDVPTVLDPAPVPADGMPRSMFNVAVLTPNQVEARMLLKPIAGRKRRADPRSVVSALMDRGARCVVLKLGDKGSMMGIGDVILRGQPFGVNVVDTTAAGDAFTGALAVAIAEKFELFDEVLPFANAAGALCCTQLGAQPALPTRLSVDSLLAGRG